MYKLTSDIYYIPGDPFPSNRTDLTVSPYSNVFCIGSQDKHTLIDIGNGKNTVNLLAKNGFSSQGLQQVIFTHAHYDHTLGYVDLFESFGEKDIWIHENEAEGLINNDCLTVYLTSQRQKEFEPIINRIGKFQVAKKLKDEDELYLGNIKWIVYHFPGHSKGSIALYDPNRRILVSGDTIFADNTGWFPFGTSNEKDLLNSLDKVLQLDIELLLPGHGEILEGNVEEALQDNVDQLIKKLSSKIA